VTEGLWVALRVTVTDALCERDAVSVPESVLVRDGDW